MVLLDCCFINCFFPSHNGKIKDVFYSIILSSLDSSLEFLLTTAESSGSITVAWPLLFLGPGSRILYGLFWQSLPSNTLIKLNLQFLFSVLYATVNGSLMFYPDYQCFMDL